MAETGDRSVQGKLGNTSEQTTAAVSANIIDELLSAVTTMSRSGLGGRMMRSLPMTTLLSGLGDVASGGAQWIEEWQRNGIEQEPYAGGETIASH